MIRGCWAVLAVVGWFVAVLACAAAAFVAGLVAYVLGALFGDGRRF
ncbi:MAG: hypothetical protein ABL933_15720 [Methyloglobulus sp.]